MVDFRMPDHICTYLVIHVAICVCLHIQHVRVHSYIGINVPIHLRLGLYNPYYNKTGTERIATISLGSNQWNSLVQYT